MNQDQSYLLDIAKFCQTIIRLTQTMTEAEFYATAGRSIPAVNLIF